MQSTCSPAAHVDEGSCTKLLLQEGQQAAVGNGLLHVQVLRCSLLCATPGSILPLCMAHTLQHAHIHRCALLMRGQGLFPASPISSKILLQSGRSMPHIQVLSCRLLCAAPGSKLPPLHDHSFTPARVCRCYLWWDNTCTQVCPLLRAAGKSAPHILGLSCSLLCAAPGSF